MSVIPGFDRSKPGIIETSLTLRLLPVYLVIDCLVLAIRAFSIVVAFQAAGGYVFLRIFERELANAIEPIQSLVRWSAMSGAFAAMGYYFLVPARMAGSFEGVFDTVLAEIVAASSIQSAQLAVFIGLALIGVGVDGEDVFKRVLCLLGVGLTMLSFALTGHTTIHGLRVVLAPALLLHVGVAAMWFGALWPLRIMAAAEPRAVRTAVIERFSGYAVRAVPMLLVVGLLMAAIFLGSIEQLATAYGMMLGIKILGFAGILAIANYNRTRLSPAMARGDSRAVRTFRQVIVIEAVAIAAVVLATVLMTGFFAPENLHGSFSEDHDAEVHE